LHSNTWIISFNLNDFIVNPILWDLDFQENLVPVKIGRGENNPASING